MAKETSALLSHVNDEYHFCRRVSGKKMENGKVLTEVSHFVGLSARAQTDEVLRPRVLHAKSYNDVDDENMRNDKRIRFGVVTTSCEM